jgi:D-aminoacyl-tRNA deacylase
MSGLRHPKPPYPFITAFVSDISRETGKQAKTGDFGAEMEVELLNHGPVTIIIDTRNKE